MVINEHSRHELYGKLEQVLGDQAATTLMEHLPPVGWADVATKQDLRVLEQRMDMWFEIFENRMLAAFKSELVTMTRSMIFTTVGSVFTAVSLTVAAVTIG